MTGGAGYIGSFTVDALQSAGHDVVVYDNLCYGHRNAIDAELIECDVGDVQALDNCLGSRQFDAIIHFAAYIEAGQSMKEAGRFFENNTGNTIRLLNAAARHGIDKFVFSSTAAVYGNPVHLPIKESDPTVPTNVYGESKLQVERMLPWYDLVHGIRSVSLRYFNATGAALDGSKGQDHLPATHLLTVAIQAALGQRPNLPLYGTDYPTPDGTCIRDYVHVLDLASAHVLAVEHLARGGSSDVFNIGTGKGKSNLEVIRAVRKATGVDFSVETCDRRSGDPVQLAADPAKLQRTLDWQPRYSDLETIVGSAWDWHRTHPNGYSA